ncbi:MAG: anti-sigma factor family protein [Candidatus Kryptonium sp.]
MDCRQTREFLSALVDNEEIDSQTKQEVEEHIWRCATCRTELELEKKTKETIKTKVKIIPVPNELITSVLNQVRILQNGYAQSLEVPRKFNPAPKPWLEIAFSLGVAIVTLSLAFLFVSVYSKKMTQRELIRKEVSALVNHFDSIAQGLAKPEILSNDPMYIQNEILSRANFTPMFFNIPDFKIVGASIKAAHQHPDNANCVNLIYRKGEQLIFIHQAPMSSTPMHDDIKKRILKGEWIYDTITDDSFVIWGTSELVCCAISNLPKEELEKVLKQSK